MRRTAVKIPDTIPSGAGLENVWSRVSYEVSFELPQRRLSAELHTHGVLVGYRGCQATRNPKWGHPSPFWRKMWGELFGNVGVGEFRCILVYCFELKRNEICFFFARSRARPLKKHLFLRCLVFPSQYAKMDLYLFSTCVLFGDLSQRCTTVLTFQFITSLSLQWLPYRFQVFIIDRKCIYPRLGYASPSSVSYTGILGSFWFLLHIVSQCCHCFTFILN